MLRVKVVAQTAHPPEVGHPVESHVAQGQQLAGVVVVPGEPEAVTGQVEVTDVLTITERGSDGRFEWKIA